MNRQQAFLLVLVALSGAVSLLLVLPFLEYVLAALIFGYVLYPAYRWIEPYAGRRFGPILIILGGIVALILPLGYVSLVLYRDLQAIAAGNTGLDLEEVEARIGELTGEEVDLEAATAELVRDLTELLFGNVTELVTFSFKATLGLALVLFLVYYTLRDGPAFVSWVTEVTPLSDPVADRLITQIERTTWGVIVGHIFVAVLQGAVGGVGLFIAGIPNVTFWTFVMVILALLPLIGAFFVWGPAVSYLWIVGEPRWALFLAFWGVAVVSVIDNYARPIVIDQRAHLNPGVVLIGVFGGVYTIGFTGLFVGPIIIGVFAATLAAFHRDYDGLDESAHPPDADDRVARSGDPPKAGNRTEPDGTSSRDGTRSDDVGASHDDAAESDDLTRSEDTDSV